MPPSYKSAFMSHAHSDNAKCDPFAEALIKRGISLYYDRSNPQVGRDLGVALEQEIQRANVLILMVTPAALGSFWVNQEIRMFFALMAHDPSRMLIPVKLEPCEMPPRLDGFWWVDATTQPLMQVIDQLAVALKLPHHLTASPSISQSTAHPNGATPPAPQTSTPPTSLNPPMQTIPAPSYPQQVTSSPGTSPILVSTTNGSPGKSISRRALIAAGAVGVVTLGAGVIWWSRTTDNPRASAVSRETSTTGASPTASPSPGPSATSTPTASLIYRGHSAAVQSVAWSPRTARIASAGQDGTIQLWDAATGSHRSTYHGHSDNVLSVAWSPDGLHVASGCDDGFVQGWNASGVGQPQTVTGDQGAAYVVAWSPDGTQIASGASYYFSIDTWGGGDSSANTAHGGSVYAIVWMPGGKRIATGGQDGTVQISDAATGFNVVFYRGHSGSVRALSRSPDGTQIASGGSDGTVQVWDAADGGNTFTYRGHSGAVYAVAWSPDGTFIASGGLDRTVQMWNAADGSHLYTFRGHSDQVNSITWSPDGTQIASASRDKTVQVWHAP